MKERILKVLRDRRGKWSTIEHLAREAGAHNIEPLLWELVLDGVPVISCYHCAKIAESDFEVKYLQPSKELLEAWRDWKDE